MFFFLCRLAGRLVKFAYTHFSSVAEFPGSQQQQQIVSYMSGKFPLFASAIFEAIYFAFWPRPLGYWWQRSKQCGIKNFHRMQV